MAGARRSPPLPISRTMARILVVDDSRLERVTLERLLQSSGHECLTAENGAVGLARVVSERPDAILVDLEMPVLDGFAFLEGLRDLEQAAPAAVITGESGDAIRDRCLALGAVDVVVKPVTPESVARALGALFGEAD